MKQKRKVKSLLPKKFCLDGRMLTILLLVLSLVLCLGSVSLLTHSVKAAENGAMQIQSIPYTGIDNKVEVLYNMQFVDPSDLEKVVNNLYMSGESLYISPNIVVISGNNIVGTGIYSHILGGIGNKIYSDNVTIIAGKNNIVKSGNDNASILGGMDNVFYSGKEGGASIVSIGGQSNKVETIHDGVALIGGSGNVITGVGEISNAFILGGEENNIEQGDIDNIIIGGKGVVDIGYENIFIYSNNDGFFPKKSNVFYLNVVSGAGINTDGIEGLSVGGAVSVGDVDLNTCEDDGLYLVGTYSGCLVGCTKTSRSKGGKWELLDQGSRCEEVCNNNDKIICEKSQINPSPYTAQCTKGVNTGNAHLCVSGELSKYKNVLFETNLIDSEEKCNFTQDICVYQCNQGTHLTGAGANRRCYSDCSYTRNNGTEVRDIRHGDHIIGYDTGSVKCGDNGVTDTCTNHLTGLYCNDGHMKIGGMDGEDVDLRVYYDSCLMSKFKCDTGTYNLSYHDIDTIYLDSFSTGGLVGGQIVTGDRGVYKVCINYGGLGTDICTTGSQNFAFLGCMPGYTTGDADGVCRNGCDGLPNGTKRTRYKSGSVTCTGACEGEEFTCYDGEWTGGDKSQYPYTGCSLNDKICNTGVYNVTYEEYLTGLSTSIYECCTGYIASGNTQCNIGDVACKLVGCEDGYVTGEKYDKFCIDDDIACEAPVPHGDGVVKGPDTFKYGDLPDLTPWTYLTGDASSELGACQWRCRSESGWIWDGNLGCYQKPEEPVCLGNPPTSPGVLIGSTNPQQSTGRKYVNGGLLGPCEWTCDETKNVKVNSAQTGCICKDGYYPLADRCEKYKCTGALPGENTRNGGNSPVSGNKEWDYISDANAPLSPCEWSCKEGYIRVDGTNDCVWVSNDSCGPANGGEYTNLTVGTPGLCEGGSTANGFTETDEGWEWYCGDILCHASRSASCGPANGRSYLTLTAASSLLCSGDTAATGFTVTSLGWEWYCGDNPCSANIKAGPGGACFCDSQPAHSTSVMFSTGGLCYNEVNNNVAGGECIKDNSKDWDGANSFCRGRVADVGNCNQMHTQDDCNSHGCCIRDTEDVNGYMQTITKYFECISGYVFRAGDCECVTCNDFCGVTSDAYYEDGECYATCFIAGTKVIMADGSQKNIEDVKIGEKVLGSNGTINTVLGYDRPVLGNRHLWSINGSEYFVSDEHPFMTTEGWKSFNPEMTKLEVNLNTTELKIGDVLVTDNGLELIESVDYINADYNTPLYNFMLDGDHTYYANGYLVHNKQHQIATQNNEGCDGSYHWVPVIGSNSQGCCPIGYSVIIHSFCTNKCTSVSPF